MHILYLSVFVLLFTWAGASLAGVSEDAEVTEQVTEEGAEEGTEVGAEAVAEVAAEDSTQETPARTVEDILSRDPELGDYVKEERCIRSNRIRRMDVIDERHVAIEMPHDEYFLVQFEHRCHGLRKGKPVMHDTRGSRLCAHDAIRAMDPWGFGRMRPGPPCTIPGFQSITKEQLLHIKDALKAEKRKKRQQAQST